MSVTPPDPGRISLSRLIERLRLELADLDALAAHRPELARDADDLRALVVRLDRHTHQPA